MDRLGAGSTRWLLLAALVFAALGLLVIIGDAVLAHNRIHPGVTVSGRDVGRMTPQEARRHLGSLVEKAQESPIVLVDHGSSWTIVPQDVGTRLDVEKTVDAAYAVGRDRGPLRDLIRRLGLYVGGKDVPLRGSVDDSRMKDLLTAVSKKLDLPPVNASLKVSDGEVVITEGKGGSLVDQRKLRRELEALLLTLHSTELTVPMRDVEPPIKAAHTKAAVDQVRTMISAPVYLAYEGQRWKVSPARLEHYIDFRAEGEGADSRLVAFISADKAEGLFQDIGPDVSVKAKNATWTTDGTTASIVPARTGRAIDRNKTARALTTAALSPTDRQGTLVMSKAVPARTTEEAESMGIVRRLGTYTTEFGGSANRRDNVQLAGEKIDLTLLAPGEEFDFDGVVGQRTEANGFKTAPAIIRGELEDTLGGGICQVATTLFNAVFESGLDVTSRQNHSLYISHYPRGRDATVSWGGPAFRFRNDTPNWILIRSASSRSSLTFTIYGTPQGRKVTSSTGDWYDVTPPSLERRSNPELAAGVTRVVDEGQTGKKIKVVRKVTMDGKVIHNDIFLSHYPTQSRIIEVGTKKPTTTTTKRPVTTTTTAKPKAGTAPKTTTTTR